MESKSQKPSPEREEQISQMEQSIKAQQAIAAAKEILPDSVVFVFPNMVPLVGEVEIQALYRLISAIEDEYTLEGSFGSVMLKCDTRFLSKAERQHIEALQRFVGDLAKCQFLREMEG